MTEAASAVSGESTEESHLRTFLIADVQGYTRFTEEHGDAAAARLTNRFADITEEIVGSVQGQVIELRGDEALAVFASARNALQAGVALQARFRDRTDDPFPLHVRVGIDSGDAVPIRGGYRGGALNRAARLQSIAGPGEVLTTDAVVGLAGTLNGLVVLDRGEALLKGLTVPVKVFQIVPQDSVPTEVRRFSAGATPPTTLSPQQTRFVGREVETEAVAALLAQDQVRLLTLTGPGGIGKTRLAIRAAGVAGGSFEDGVFFVPLASVRDDASVFQSIALTLGIGETTASSRAAVRHYIGGKHMLLVLDNFEQVVSAAPQVSELLAACPRLTVLVTSREVLHLYGEHEYRVPSMQLPDLSDGVSPEVLTSVESVRLFLDRVSLHQPGFSVTEENAGEIAEICRRLDGLPLAIELAAARIKVFPPHALRARLDQRLRVLTGGPRDLPDRQQTLRNAIAWSYDLLDVCEKALFQRLAVFAGGCTADAAEVVCNGKGDLDIDVLDGLASLVDKSLLQHREGPGPEGYPESRFVMLETIREFALERLQDRGDLADIRRRHADYYCSLAEGSYDRLMSAERDPWRENWSAEWENVRAALQWSVEVRRPDIGLYLIGFLWVWCWLDGPIELRDWVDTLLGMPEAEEVPRARGWGLAAGALLAWHTGDFGRVPGLSTMAVDAGRQSGDDRLLAGALVLAATLDDSARPLAEEARARYRAQHNAFGAGFAVVAAVRSLLAEGEAALLQDWLDEALHDCRRTGDVFGQGLLLRTSGTLAVRGGDLARGRALLVEALDRFRLLREKRYLPLTLLTLGGISRLLGEYEQAMAEFREALSFVYRHTGRGNLASCFEGVAAVYADLAQYENATRLLGTARKLRESGASVPFPLGEALNSGVEQRCRGSMSAQSFALLYSEGQTMAVGDAVEGALSVFVANPERQCS